MPGQFLIKTVVHFSAAHVLTGYEGACDQIHGHNYEVRVEVLATQLDALGMGLDFEDIKKASREAIADLDHVHLNDLPVFEGQNPTAERVAALVYKRLSRALDREHVRVHAIELWETHDSCVRYSEGPR
jgi:6-pyruvoyltetrahydropterin/6-carboxytetrahydropterin synthase